MADISQVDVHGKIATNLPLDTAQSGYAALVGEVHGGPVGGMGLAARRRRVIEASREGRLQVGAPTVLFDDFFNHASQNGRKYFNVVATMTSLITGGLLTLNNAAATAAAAGNLVRSYRAIPVIAAFQTRVHIWFGLAVAPQVNNVVMVGIGIPAASANITPTDGVFVVLDSSGALSLNAYYNNGTPVTSGPITGFTFVPGRIYNFELVLHRNMIELYIDHVLVAVIERSAGAPSAGALTQGQSGHLIAQIVNTAVTTAGQKLLLAGWGVSVDDGNFGRDWEALRQGMGDGAHSAPDGQTPGQTANLVNSTAPATVTPTNTTAGYATLGGGFAITAPAGAETDLIMFAYQVPAALAGVPGETLILTNITIDLVNMGAAVAVTPHLVQWFLGIGGTAVSLATADSNTSRAAHRKALGSQALAVGTPIGGRADRVIEKRIPKIPVEPGTFVHVIARVPVGTATASQLLRGTVDIDGYFE